MVIVMAVGVVLFAMAALTLVSEVSKHRSDTEMSLTQLLRKDLIRGTYSMTIEMMMMMMTSSTTERVYTRGGHSDAQQQRTWTM